MAETYCTDLSAPLSNPLAALSISGTLLQLRAVLIQPQKRWATALLSMHEELEDQIILADEQRQEQALRLALCELLPDLVRVPDDRQAYARWCKLVDDKAYEIFSRLN